MKQRRFFLIFRTGMLYWVCIIAMLLMDTFCLCAKEGEEKRAIPGKVTFDGQGGIKTITVISNTPWKLVSQPSWCRISQTVGDGGVDTIDVDVDALALIPLDTPATGRIVLSGENRFDFLHIPVEAVSVEMIYVAPGEFMMGSNEAKVALPNEKPAHQVMLSKGYYLGKHEVKQGTWRAVMGALPEAYRTQMGGTLSFHDQASVTWVSWNDVQAFIQKLNRRTGKNYRLPTEAEWEYAARGGNKSLGRTYVLDEYVPNELGIYGMIGSTLEWCSDWYDNYPALGMTLLDPQGPDSSPWLYRVIRGGNFLGSSNGLRLSFRDTYGPANSTHRKLGFRLCL